MKYIVALIFTIVCTIGYSGNQAGGDVGVIPIELFEFVGGNETLLDSNSVLVLRSTTGDLAILVDQGAVTINEPMIISDDDTRVILPIEKSEMIQLKQEISQNPSQTYTVEGLNGVFSLARKLDLK